MRERLLRDNFHHAYTAKRFLMLQRLKELFSSREILSWALYDWANSSYATVVLVGFFPIFYKNYWDINSSPQESTLHLGISNSIPSLVMFLIAPIVGALADVRGTRKGMLLFFTIVGVIFTGLLVIVEKGNFLMASLFYILATIGFMGTSIFYDALLIHVAPREKFHLISSFGFSLGYLGGSLVLILSILLAYNPWLVGLKTKEGAIKASFLLVSLWWALFSIPLFLHVKETRINISMLKGLSLALRKVKETILSIGKQKEVFYFLLAYFFYIDGVDTIARMAVDYGLAIGIGVNKLLLCLLIVQIIGIPFALLFGVIGERFGAKAGIIIAIFGYMLITIWGSIVRREWEFYSIAVLIGIFQGGIQALSRSYYAKIIPKDRNAEYFGFFDIIGKLATVIGPSMVGLITTISQNHRIGILSITLLFLLGLLLLLRKQENLKI